MYIIYGKQKDDEKYKMLNVNTGEFVNRKLFASLIDCPKKADRICYELECENVNYFFEYRKS